MTAPRLDILLYAHDGRGLGHASRTIAIGMALRRLYPELRMLFVSGTPHAKGLIGDCRLDWLKLPSYETEIVEGKSRGIDGPANFGDRDLATLRTVQLASIIDTYRPGLVLVDHQPQGKHKELLAALATGRKYGTKWVLGVRGVVGDVPQLASELARKMFIDFYQGLIWYGDSAVLGSGHLEKLADVLRMPPFESGYVSRLAEMKSCLRFRGVRSDEPGDLAATVAIPWLDAGSEIFLEKLAAVLPGLTCTGMWHLYLGVDKGTERVAKVLSSLRRMSCCRVMKPGPDYVDSLLASKIAVIYGGYNSLTDVIGCGVPALVLMRNMADREQQLHLAGLAARTDVSVLPVSPEAVDVAQLAGLLKKLGRQERRVPAGINLHGAENSAKYLLSLLQDRGATKSCPVRPG